MNTFVPPLGFVRTLVSIAVLAVLVPTRAQDAASIEELSTPQSTVAIGLGVLSGDKADRARFGQYNGMRKNSAYGLLDIDFVRRDDTSGTWTSFEGRNLGLDSRELRFGQQKQGDWRYSAEYSELVRRSPYTINTGVQGAGTTTPVVTLLTAPGAGTDLDLQLKRQGLGLNFEKWLGKNVQLEVNFKTEDKNGARLFGRGFTCPSGAAPAPTCTAAAAGVNQWALLMLPEPVDSTIRQIDAKLNYTTEKLAMSAGYYGSFYTNHNGALAPTVPGTLNNALGTPVALQAGLQGILQMPIALQPDNQAHQLYVSGTYGFTPSTRANFKLAYTHATQHDDFAAKGLSDAPAGITNYGGVVDTTLAQVGLTAHPVPALTLNTSLRYEDRKDKSPLAQYNIEGTNRYLNGTYSVKKSAAKLEASVQLPMNYRGTAGVEYEGLDRGQLSSPECIDLGDGTCLGDSVAGLSGLRAKTHETSFRVELRRSLADTLSGAIGFVHARRDGSPWLKPLALPATGVIEANADPACVPPPAPAVNNCIYNRTGIFPLIFMDRSRDKVKLSGEWAPSEQLSLQLVVEDGRDIYSAPTTKGLQETRNNLISVDATWNVSDAWKITGFASQSKQALDVAQGNLGYIAALENTNSTMGLGVQGKVSGKLDVGADASYSDDINRYGLRVDQGVPPLSAANQTTLANNIAQAAIGLPDVRYRLATLKLFGRYALQKNAAVRVDLLHQQSHLRDWAWGYAGTPFVFSDGTTVNQQTLQKVTFLGVTYIHSFR